MSDVRWEGYSHQEIYDSVHRGPGREISAPAELAWAETEALILRIDERIAAAMAGSAAGWEGSAADATRTAVTPLGRWALDAANDAKITAQAVTAQGEQARELRVTMPEPVTAQWNAELQKAQSDPMYILYGLDDMQAIEQDGANRSARAVELMNTYTNNSYENRRHMDYWTFPPQVTVVTGLANATGMATGAVPASLDGPGVGGLSAAVAAATTAGPAAGGPIPAAVPSPVPVAAPSTVPGGPGGTSTSGGPGGAPIPVIPGRGAGPDAAGATPGPGARPTPAPAVPAPGPTPAPGAAPIPAALIPAAPIPAAARPSSGNPVTAPGRPGSTNAPSPLPPGGAVPSAGGAVPGGVRPVVPGPPPRGAPQPSWRDVVTGGPSTREPVGRVPVPGAVDQDRVLPPPGAGRTPLDPPGRATPAGERPGAPVADPAARGPGQRPAGVGPMGGMYPPLAGAGAGQDRERRRPDYLLDDSDAFADDRWFPPAVITPDDGPEIRS